MFDIEKSGQGDTYLLKRLQDQLQRTNTLLRLFSIKTSRKEYLDEVLELLQAWSDCRCVGIRVLNKDGFIPYESYVGFSREFWESENSLSIHQDSCICSRVITGEVNPLDSTCITNFGSFCSSDVTDFISKMSEQQKQNYRCKCAEEGFRTLTIIPIHYQERILGVIQLADEREGLLDIVDFIEDTAPLIGEALFRFNLEDELRKRNNELEEMVCERTQELKLVNELLQTDIDKRKKLEEYLKEEISFRQVLIDTIPNPVFYKDIDGTYLGCNKSFESVMGYSKEHIKGKTVFDLNPKDFADKYYEMDNMLFKQQGTQEYEFTMLHNDGTRHNVIYNKAVYRNKSGNIAGLLGVMTDITSRKQMERSLQFLASIIESSSNAIYSTDLKGLILTWNPSAQRIFGYSPDEIIGQSAAILYPPEMQTQYRQFLKKVNNGEYVSKYETLRVCKDGSRVNVSVTKSPIKNINGEVIAISLIAEDISQRIQMEKEMMRLDRLNLVGEMAAGIAHEIRNPMTTVKGFLQLFRDKEKYSEEKAHLDLMIDELDRANSIITEFLSLAKNRVVDLKLLNLNSLIETLFPLLQADALVRDMNLNLELGEVEDILLDEKEIRQLLINLVRNGFEAMSSGGQILIRTYQEGNELVLAIQDHGAGIPPEILDKLGTPFLTTKENGSGLGLATCFSIANRHNANIEISNSSPEGTTFCIRFKRIKK